MLRAAPAVAPALASLGHASRSCANSPYAAGQHTASAGQLPHQVQSALEGRLEHCVSLIDQRRLLCRGVLLLLVAEQVYSDSALRLVKRSCIGGTL